MKVKIHHEGTNIIVLLALALVAINVLLHFFAAKWLFITVLVISVILMCLVLNFFRLPHRHFESESPLDVVASVDGVVVALEEVLEELIDRDPGPDQVWNVNFPGCPLAACSGILRDRTMSQAIVYEDWYQPARQLPGGGIRYVVSGEMQCRAEAGSDFDAILRGAVSIGRVRNLC